MGPGVYVFYGNNNNVLYVGKSKSLRNRVSSYFQSRADLIPKVRRLVSQISKIKISQTKTEFEALLVEARLIRELGSKYNSRLTDDRSPLYILVTDEEFPRVLTARKTDLGGIESRSVYGPFLSGETVRRVLKIARKLFPYCNQKRTVLAVRQGQSFKCFYRHLGLCPGVCSREISKRQYLGIIRKLEQFLAGDFADLKVKLEKEMKTAAKKQEFETAAKTRDAAEALGSLTLAGEQEEDAGVTAKERMEALVRLLVRSGSSSFPSVPIESFRIEGFDVSNLGGRLATAGMAVFVGGIREIGEYRHFRIMGKFTPDDPRMIAEAVERRMGHPEWGSPDLMVIDGGKPQLAFLKRTVPAVRQGLSLIGLAKNPDRLVIPAKIGFKTIRVSLHDLGFQLLQQVRDEAHRFSRRLHHRLRKRGLVG